MNFEWLKRLKLRMRSTSQRRIPFSGRGGNSGGGWNPAAWLQGLGLWFARAVLFFLFAIFAFSLLIWLLVFVVIRGLASLLGKGQSSWSEDWQGVKREIGKRWPGSKASTTDDEVRGGGMARGRARPEKHAVQDVSWRDLPPDDDDSPEKSRPADD